MNDEQVIERVRAAVESRLADVRREAPELVGAYPTARPAPVPRRSRWLLPIGLAAAAAVVLGVVLVSRGDDASDTDVPITEPDGVPEGLERWVLEAVLETDGAALVAAEDATTSATAIGTSVYYRGDDGNMAGAVARTSGASIGLARSSWPVLETLDVLGATATRYDDGNRELLVISTEPPLIVETYGALDAVALARTAQLVGDVWVLGSGDLEEIGRRTEQSGALRFSYLEYRVGDELRRTRASTQTVTVVRHPAGVIGSLLDTGLYPERRVTDAAGTGYLVVGPSSAVLDRTTGDVVTVDSRDGDDVLVLAGQAVLRRVDEATWRALVSPVRPDLGDPNAPPTSVVATTMAGSTARYQAVGTVIEIAGKGVQLCLGGVMESLPPQCDGVPVDPVSWRWPDGTFQEQSGVRWAEYVVVGMYDGTTFTPIEDPRPVTPADWDGGDEPAPDLHTRCSEPDGGWLAAAASAPTGADAESALVALADYGAAEADFAGMWLDQSADPPRTEGEANDPTKYVVNVAFASTNEANLNRHRAELARLWSGALCVFARDGLSLDELEAIQSEVGRRPGVLTSGIDITRGVVTVRVVLNDGELQAELDGRYGTGTVIVGGALTAIR